MPMITASPNVEAPSMIHQSVAIPWAGGLSGWSELCFEPHPVASRTSGSSVRSRASGNLSPDGFTPDNGYPARTR
jgi:hypothetical protein